MGKKYGLRNIYQSTAQDRQTWLWGSGVPQPQAQRKAALTEEFRSYSRGFFLNRSVLIPRCRAYGSLLSADMHIILILKCVMCEISAVCMPGVDTYLWKNGGLKELPNHSKPLETCLSSLLVLSWGSYHLSKGIKHHSSELLNPTQYSLLNSLS